MNLTETVDEFGNREMNLDCIEYEGFNPPNIRFDFKDYSIWFRLYEKPCVEGIFPKKFKTKINKFVNKYKIRNFIEWR